MAALERELYSPIKIGMVARLGRQPLKDKFEQIHRKIRMQEVL